MSSEALGIEEAGPLGFLYFKSNNNKELMKEWFNTFKFLKLFFNTNNFEEFKNINFENIKFINYGSNELVYVVKINNEYYTLIVGQPTLDYGKLKDEYNNLKNLSRHNSSLVVKPIHYFTDGNKELYISKYLYQARCISNNGNKWGIYIPEPNYRFEEFSSFDENLVNTCIVCNLVKLYNTKKEIALGNCNLKSGDFILEKKWSYTNKTLQNTMNNMKLIAARDTIDISLKDYINELRKQLKKYTRSSIKNNIKYNVINENSRFMMSEDAVENGIKLGLKNLN